MSSKVVKGKDAVIRINGKKVEGVMDFTIQEAQAIERAQEWGKVYEEIARMYGYSYGGCDIGTMTSKDAAIQTLPKNAAFEFEVVMGKEPKVVGIDYADLEPRVMASLTPEELKAVKASVSSYGGSLRGWKQFPNETHCPKCQVKWKKTEGFNRFYEDCPKCGGKKEDAR
jgi:hypothetical protein